MKNRVTKPSLCQPEKNIKNFDKGAQYESGFISTTKEIKDKNHGKYFLKLIPKDRIKKYNLGQNLSQQIDNCYSLNSKTIQKLEDHFEDKENVYLLFEPNVGQSVKQLLAGTVFNESQIKNILLQLALTLQYIHHHKIIHRNIRSENIFVTFMPDPIIKITDFVANDLYQQDFNKVKKSLNNHYFYAAPELLQNQYHDFTVDIWAFGCVAFEIMTGKTPFLPLDKTKDIEKLIEKNVLSGKFLFPAYFPEIFKDLISRCLEINPKDRIRWNDIIHHKAFSDSSISMKDLMIQLQKRNTVEDMTPSSRQTEEYFMDRETRRLKYASLTFSESIDCAELNTEYYTNRISLHKQKDEQIIQEEKDQQSEENSNKQSGNEDEDLNDFVPINLMESDKFQQEDRPIVERFVTSEYPTLTLDLNKNSKEQYLDEEQKINLVSLKQLTEQKFDALEYLIQKSSQKSVHHSNKTQQPFVNPISVINQIQYTVAMAQEDTQTAIPELYFTEACEMISNNQLLYYQNVDDNVRQSIQIYQKGKFEIQHKQDFIQKTKQKIKINIQALEKIDKYLDTYFSTFPQRKNISNNNILANSSFFTDQNISFDNSKPSYSNFLNVFDISTQRTSDVDTQHLKLFKRQQNIQELNQKINQTESEVDQNWDYKNEYALLQKKLEGVKKQESDLTRIAGNQNSVNRRNSRLELQLGGLKLK